MSHREEQKSELTQSEATDRVWELANDIDVCMFITRDGEYSRARLNRTGFAGGSNFQIGWSHDEQNDEQVFP